MSVDKKAVKLKAKKEAVKSNSTSTPWLSFILLAILILVVFSSAIPNSLTNWDDGVYIADNNLIKELSFDNFKNIFSSYVASNYHPVTILSYAIEYNFFGSNPSVFHVVNIFIHIFNTWLVFLLIKHLAKNNTISLVTALLFAIHPMHVESVAWISERKDVLYTFFFLLSLLSYLKYTTAEVNRTKLYLYSLLLFLLSLLSKGMAVTLPVVMFVVDYFNDRKITSKTIVEKIPFFVLSIVFGAIAVYAQRATEAMELKADYSFVERIFLGSYGFTLYIIKAVIPFNLSAFYPYPAKAGTVFPVLVYTSVLVPLAMLAAIFFAWKKKNKIVFVGLSFFVITIALVLQFIPVGNAIMAERYSYVPYIGLFFIGAFYFNQLYSNKSKMQTVLVGAIVYLLLLAFITYNRCKVWQDSETLWSNVLENHPNADIAYLNRGIHIVVRGQEEQAFKDFTKAIELNPRYKEAYNNRGLVKQGRNDFAGSIEDFSMSIVSDSSYVEGYSNRAISYLYLKKNDEAIKDFNKALELSPEYANVYSNLGNLYIDIGEREKGMKDLLIAKELYRKKGDMQSLQRVSQRIDVLNSQTKPQ